jgi:hypothetical protein
VKIYVYPADQTGCGKYRMYWPAEALKAEGHDITIVDPGGFSYIGGRVQDGKLVEVHYPTDADVIVLQRPSSKWLVQAIPLLRAKGVAVVVDMDDDLSAIHPSNPAFRLQHPKTAPMQNWAHVAEGCRQASLVTVSTPALMRRYASHGRGVIIPNCVPERFLKVHRSDSDIVGWAGALHSHPDDPPVVGGSLRLAGVPYCQVVGPAETGLDRAFGVQCKATGLVAFDDWAEKVSRLGIGLAPLADTRFNQAKSWLKPLEYAAVGVPWVGSDTVEYRRFHELGSGAVAVKPKHWAGEIKRLRSNPSYRQDQSEAGRMVAAEWTIEGNAWRWLEAWEGARA